MSDTKTYPLSLDLVESSAISEAIKEGMTDTEAKRVGGIARVSGRMIQDFKQMAKASAGTLTVDPLDVMDEGDIAKVRDAYTVLSGFQSYTDWLRMKYGSDAVPPMTTINETCIALLHIITVFEDERKAQS